MRWNRKTPKTLFQSSFHDGMMPLWFHSGCFFLKNLPTSVTEFENFDNIRWEDQESLKSQVESPPAPPEPSKGKKSLKRPQSLRPDFSIELASSNRSKCVGCEAPIIKGFIRIGKLDTESKLGVGGTHPDPTNVYKTEDGVQVPYGVGVNSEYHGKCCLLHNEYIIYNVGQVNIKYLIGFRFAY